MKLKDLLHHNYESAFPNQERVLKRVLNHNKKMIAAWIFGGTFLAVIITVAVIWSSSFFKTPNKEVLVSGDMNIIESVESKEGDLLHFSIGSRLHIKTTEDVSAKQLKARIAIEPNAEFSIKKTGACSYDISFNNLDENALYNIVAVYNGKNVYRWAFQTETPFSITTTSPTNSEKASVDSAVEVTFSHGDVSGYEKAFSISPKVEGSFEHYGRTWGFIPAEPLQESTLYTVTIDTSVKGPNGAMLSEDHSFSFKTEDGDSFAYLLYRENDISDTFLADERPIAAVAYKKASVTSAKVEVYSLKDSNTYINAYKETVLCGEVSDKIMDYAKQKQIEFEVTPVIVSNYNGFTNAAFINYPDALPLGYYFAKIEIAGKTLYQLLQSTDLAVYTLSTNGDHVVWVNDGRNGATLSGAKVSLEGFSDTKTTSAGVAILKDSNETLKQRFMVVDSGSMPYVAVLSGESVDPVSDHQSKYYTYITTDSAVYREGETIGIFGAVYPRSKKIKNPKNVTVEVDFLEEPIVLELDENGAFNAKISLSSTAMNYGEIKLKFHDIHMDSAYFTIQNQEIVPYKMSVFVDRKAYKAGETVQFSAQVTHSDDTPASGIRVETGDGFKGVTDENGMVSGSLIAEVEENVGNFSVNRLFLQIENQDIFADVPYLVFASDYIVEAECHGGKLNVAAFEADLAAAEYLTDDALLRGTFDPAVFKGAPASVTVLGELHALSFAKEPKGETYDAVNKKSEPYYLYVEKDTPLRSFEVFCNNGIGSVEIPEQVSNEVNYYVNLSIQDATHVSNQTYLEKEHYLSIFNHEGTYSISTEKDEFGIGDTVTIQVRDCRDNSTVNSGSVFYTVVSGGVLDVFQSASAVISFGFKQEYASQVAVYGVYFDGKHVYSLGREILSYRVQDSILTVEMETELEQYQPGSEAVLQFTVRDAKGAPVAATLNINLMDQDLYLNNSNAVDPSHDLYASAELLDEAVTIESHRDYRKIMKNHHNEAWEDLSTVHCDYEPSPYFESVKSDAQGRASVTVKLPESLTQWKVIARAVSSSAQGGIGVFDLGLGRGFYTDAIVAEKIATTDDCVIALRSAGSYLDSGSLCSYKVGITDQDGTEIKTLEVSGEKDRFVYLNFGKLSAGLYTAYIQSNYEKFTDSAIQSFEVGDDTSGVVIQGQQNDEMDLELLPVEGSVTLTVVDQEFSFWQKALARLISSSGNRVDQRLAEALANSILESGSLEGSDEIYYSGIRTFVEAGGIGFYENSEYPDLKLSAKIAAVAPQFFDVESMKHYFGQYLNNRYASRADQIIAYFGLAALGEPVLSDLQVLYLKDIERSAEEWIYMALAFAYGGDYTTAEYITAQHIEKYLAGDEEYKCIAIENAVEMELTGAVSLLSARLSLEYCENLLYFMMENYDEESLLNLGLIAFLDHYLPNIIGENKVAIATSDGTVNTYSYQRYQPLILNIEREAAKNIRVNNMSGSSSVSYCYKGSITDALGEKEPLSGVEIPRNLKLGSRGTIKMELNVPKGTDSALLQFSLPYGIQLLNGSVKTAQEEQVIAANNSHAFIVELPEGNARVLLTVRGALPGTFEMEPVVISDGKGHFMIGEASIVTVK